MLLADVLVCFLSLFIGVPANDTKSCAVSGFTSLLKCSSCSELKNVVKMKMYLELLRTSNLLVILRTLSSSACIH
ncbi:unnamed protein product [Schistosoma guineensis]|nr:unnamed protein product [Schistosoma guineensis]CAH8463411.1 unnamed protein product [Schistosoma curassoni]CAH8466187.1 unnamed protein product [Schistosoma haematobium]